MATTTSFSGNIANYGNRLQILGTSGYDTQALLEMELAAFEAKSAPLTAQKTKYETQKTTWTSFQTMINNLKTTIDALKKAGSTNKSVTMSSTGFANITANGNLPDGTHTLEVTRVATRSKIMGDVLNEPYQSLGIDATVKINGKELKLTRNMAAPDIVGAINGNSDYKASAVIVAGRLLITSSETGEQNTLDFNDSNSLIVRGVSSDRFSMTSKVADAGAVVPGTYAFEVSQLAQKHQVQSGKLTKTDEALGYSGTMSINGVEITVTGSDSAKTIADKINKVTETAKVKATITAGKLSLESTETGAASAISITDGTSKSGESNSFMQKIGLLSAGGSFANETRAAQDAVYTVNGVTQTSSDNIDRSIDGMETTLYKVTKDGPITLNVTSSEGNAFESLGILNSAGEIKNEVEKGQDALYTVNGVELKSASNTITDAINGVTFELLKKTTEPIELKFAQDNEDLKTKIKNFVTDYNRAITQINKLAGEEGELQGQIIPNQIKAALGRAIFGDTPSNLRLYQVGIEIDGIAKDGTLSLDENKLTDLLTTRPADVARLFEGDESIPGAMYDILDKTTKTDGSLFNKLNGLTSTLKGIEKSLDRNDERYEQMKESLIKKYAKFDVAMGTLKAQTETMTALLKGLNGNKDD